MDDEGVGRWHALIGYPQVNRYFTLFCFGFLAVVGSASSSAWIGGGIWCLFEVASGRRKPTRDRHVLILASFMYLYVAWSLLSALLNPLRPSDAEQLLALGPFLLFPFSYSVWSISNKQEIARAAIYGSVFTAYAGCALAILQFYFLGMRAEGGDGNPLVFATVLVLAASVVLAGALSLERARAPLLLGAYFAALFALFLSGSRLQWVAAVVATAFVLWTYRRNVRGLMSRKAVVILAVALLVIMLPVLGIVVRRYDLLIQRLAAPGGKRRLQHVAGNTRCAVGDRAVAVPRTSDLRLWRAVDVEADQRAPDG